MKTLLVALVPFLAATGLSEAATLELKFGGSAYEGPPAYEVMLDDKAVATGTLSNAEGEDVSVDVPDEVAASATRLSVQLTNDAYGGPGQDRNLYVYAVKLAGTDIPLGDFQLTDPTQAVGHAPILNGRLELWRNSEVAVASLSPAGKGEPPAPAGPAAAASAQPAAATPPATASASAAPASAPAPACDGKLVVRGFAFNAAHLTASQKQQLDTMTQSADTGCRVVITGYASADSAPAGVNTAISLKRAQLVVDYLRDKGTQFAAAKVVGGGGTTTFGSVPKDNRVVTIEFAKPTD